MLIIIIRQAFNFLVSLFILSVFTFGLAKMLPQGTAFIIEPDLNPIISSSGQQVTTANHFYFFEEYYFYLKQVLSGNLGTSSVRGTSVFEEFFIYFPATFELSLSALFFALVLGVPLGILAAKQKNKWPDKLIISSTLVGYSMPVFWWAMLLILFFSLWLGVTPVASRIGFEFDIQPVTGFMLIDTLLSGELYSKDAFYSALHHIILPGIVLGTVPLAIITRITRSSMITSLSEDYIRSAKARGISSIKILWRHALRNAMLPIMTTLGLQVTVLMTGALLTEFIFSWPGAGKWLLEAVYRRDFPVIHGGILAIACFVIIIHLFLDFIQLFLDPKLRRNA